MSQPTIQNIPGTYTDPTTSVNAADKAQPTRSQRKAASGSPQLPVALETPMADQMVTQKAIIDPASPDRALDKLEKALTTLKNADGKVDDFISEFSDIFRFIGAILIKNADAMRQSALNDRMAAREAARDALLGQAGKLHDAADKTRTLAIVAIAAVLVVSVASIIASVISIGSSVMERSAATAAAKGVAGQKTDIKNLESLRSRVASPEDANLLSRKITEAETSVERISKDAEARIAMLQRLNQRSLSAAQIANAAGSVIKSVEGILQADVKSTEADATLLSSYAQFDQQRADAKKELYDKVIDLVQQSINTYRNLQQSQVEAMRAVTRS